MTLPAAGLKLIKEFEGCRLTAYPDPLSGGKPYTCGWGSTRKRDGSPFSLGETISQVEADSLLEEECEKHFLPSLTKVPYWNEMSPEQQGALLSFAYNLGAGFVGDRSNFNSINTALESKANWVNVPAALYKYRNPGSSVEAGLARRRTAEGDLWKKGMAGGSAAPAASPAAPAAPVQTVPPSKVLINFFKFYDENNDNHVAAVELLEASIPEHLNQDSPWVVTYRGGNATGGKPDLHKFFEFFSERNSNHLTAVAQLEAAMKVTDPDCLVDDGAGGATDSAWIEKYRSKPPIPPVLPVPYFNQVDNYRDAHRTCNSSSCAMCLEFLKPGTLSGPKGDDAYVTKVFQIGDTTDHAVQTKVLASYGVKSHFSYNLSFADLDKSLARGKPVVIGILHRGSLSAPTGGHMCVVIGKKGDGYVVNDPYGSCNDNYTGPVTNGKGTVYSRAMLKARWCPGGNDGWGRIFD
jgi:GH24 family phage-related lysozyme (muramidase)